MKTSRPLLCLATALFLGGTGLLSAQPAPAPRDPPGGLRNEAPRMTTMPKPQWGDSRRSKATSRTPAAFDATSNTTAARIKFSDPSQPGTLKFTLPWADVKITGTDGDEVTVTSSLERKREKDQVDADGFRRLDDDVSFELTEKNNVVAVALAGDQHWGAQGADFRIAVPRGTHLVVRTQLGGDIEIRDIDGDIDVNSMNGEVTLSDIGSSAIVNTMNGEITALFRRPPTKPVSITSMNGEIDLQLPTETKASVRLRTHNGSIRTNFAPERLVTQPDPSARRVTVRTETDADLADLPADVQREVRAAKQEAAHAAREAAQAAHEAATVVRAVVRGVIEGATGTAPAAPVAPMPPAAFGGKSISGVLNGGGVDISLSTMNGTITLREQKD